MQTATDSIDPRSVRETLARLKSGVSSVATGEAALLKSKAERHAVMRREALRHAENETEKLDIRIHALSADFNQRNERFEAASEQRRNRLQQAYHSSKFAIAQQTQQIKDRRIGNVQGEIMRNRQSRQQEFEQAIERHRAFRASLIAHREVRRNLRKSVLCSFRSFRPCIEGLFNGRSSADAMPETGTTPEETRTLLLERLEEARGIATAANRLPMVAFFRFLPLWILASVILAMHLWMAMRTGGGGMRLVMPSLLIAEGVLLAIWIGALISSLAVIRRAASALATARELEVAADGMSGANLAALDAEIKGEHAEESRNLSETFRESDDEWRARLAEGQHKLDQRYARSHERLVRLHQRGLGKIKAAHEQALTQARMESEERTRGFATVQNTVKSAIEAETQGNLDALALSWRDTVLPTLEEMEALDAESRTRFPAWNTQTCASWEPPDEAPRALRIGGIKVDIRTLTGGMPADERFNDHSDGILTIPLALAFPDQGSILIESDGTDDGASTRALHAIALRIFASHPPGRVSFVFIDPVGLGKEFAGLMHLADYEETLIHHRIWTQTIHIEERLAELNDHIEKVIQMYLRDEFANITEYNQQAGTIAEKYRFLVISGFPSGFSDTAMKRLLSIATSGARCGVHLLIQRDIRQAAPYPALDDELRRTCLRVLSDKDGFRLDGAPDGAEVVVFDPPPAHQDSIALVHRIGRASVDSNRVQVPFSQVAPPDAEIWKSDTSQELRVPVGRTGAKKLQMLAIGKGTRQHMLVAGKTGSGKSTLFHVIITNLSLWCSPEQVEFYLVDFKKGVEFKCYAAKHLPHARVVAIESDREFALSVLQRVDAELKRRGELFRHAGTQDLAGYKRSAGSGPLPRTLLLIDEFQEFFTEDDAVAQESSLLLDRIVRQGRAFGIHVILGSQTLGGAYTLARATLGQMVIRVALQCNETDAHLIMDDDNPAPRLLTRPGEGIYNDQAGALAANSPFQIVWLPENERDDILDRITSLASASSALPPPPIVFEGNAPADVRDNMELHRLFESRPGERPLKSRAWLGAPNSIKGPTEAVFQRQSGSHLLSVGQSSERSLALLAISLVSLAVQYPPAQAEFVILDPHASDPGGGEPFQRLAGILPHRIRIGGPAELAELMGGLGAELTARTPTSGRDAPEVFLLVHELQRFRNLRPEDDFRFSMDDDASAGTSPSKVFADLLGEGGSCGMHVIAGTDTWNNVSRWIPRKLMSEFEMRVLFQMSANDSANLIDSPAAANLGLHRALFFNEHLGTLETFRPYAMPGDAWLENIADSVKPEASQASPAPPRH
jgi:S-DNA-T family DNA segregation ATPase FtsK/SpoIIIE